MGALYGLPPRAHCTDTARREKLARHIADSRIPQRALDPFES